jgi:hypothetical protein
MGKKLTAKPLGKFNRVASSVVEPKLLMMIPYWVGVRLIKFEKTA